MNHLNRAVPLCPKTLEAYPLDFDVPSLEQDYKVAKRPITSVFCQMLQRFLKTALLKRH